MAGRAETLIAFSGREPPPPKDWLLSGMFAGKRQRVVPPRGRLSLFQTNATWQLNQRITGSEMTASIAKWRLRYYGP